MKIFEHTFTADKARALMKAKPKSKLALWFRMRAILTAVKEAASEGKSVCCVYGFSFAKLAQTDREYIVGKLKSMGYKAHQAYWSTYLEVEWR
jgi:hypothetical protein